MERGKKHFAFPDWFIVMWMDIVVLPAARAWLTSGARSTVQNRLVWTEGMRTAFAGVSAGHASPGVTPACEDALFQVRVDSRQESLSINWNCTWLPGVWSDCVGDIRIRKTAESTGCAPMPERSNLRNPSR